MAPRPQFMAAVAVASVVLVKIAQVEPLRGPLLFIDDVAAENKAFGLIATPVLALGMLSVVVKPNVGTWFLCWVSVLLWLVLGLSARGSTATPRPSELRCKLLSDNLTCLMQEQETLCIALIFWKDEAADP